MVLEGISCIWISVWCRTAFSGEGTESIWGLCVSSSRGSMSGTMKWWCSLQTSLNTLLNRKNGPTVRIHILCHLATGGWGNHQTHDGQEGKNHCRAHADREGLYQRSGSLHQGSDSASEKQAGKLPRVESLGVTSRSEFTYALFADNLKASTEGLHGAWAGFTEGRCARTVVRKVGSQVHFWSLSLQVCKTFVLRCLPAPRLRLQWQLPLSILLCT